MNSRLPRLPASLEIVVTRSNPEDWAEVLERMLAGDRASLARLTRLIASLLYRWNATDFRDDWDDLIQEVLISTGRALAEGRIRDRAAVFGYLRQTARNGFNDRLRAHLKLREDEHLAWNDELDRLDGFQEEHDERIALRSALDRAMDQLDETTRWAVRAVHVDGLSYGEASKALGLAPGTLKDRVRAGVRRLRVELERGGGVV